jgi:hypothetical protein
MSRYRIKGIVAYCLKHPSDGLVLARAGWRLRRQGWWYRWPFLPVPGAKYWEFRRLTALGHEGTLSVADAVAAAKWSLRQPVNR